MNWIQIARQTAIADKRHYTPLNRPRDLTRIARQLYPNLHRPVFIVGAPRSGTTFLGRCVGVLPEFSYHFEPIATKAASKYIYEGQWGFFKARFFYHQVYASLMRLHFDGDLQFAEKTPRNCFLVDFLANAFPQARFIHIIRDGRDVALSYSKKKWLQASQASSQLKEPGGYAYGPYARFWVEPERKQEFETTSDIHRCIWAWRRFTESVLASTVKTSERYFELRYEDLVRSPDRVSEKLLSFLDISKMPSRSKFQASVSQANPNLIGQWRHELSDHQIQCIQGEAGDLLAKLEYTF